MSNSFDEYSNHLFSIFFGDLRAISKNVRLQNLDEEEKAFYKDNFEKAELIDKSFAVHNIECALYSLKNAQYLVIKNLNNIQAISESGNIAFTVEDLNPTIYLLSAKDLDLKLDQTRHSFDEVENAILHQQEDSSYIGHDWREMSAFTDRLLIVKIEPDSVLFKQNFESVMFYILSYSDEIKHLQFSSDLLNKYRELFLVRSLTIKENVFLSLTSTHWKHSFLEIYRCVEAIYSLPWALSIKKELDLDKPAKLVAAAVVDALSFRGREKSSFVELLSLWPKLNESSVFTSSIFDGIDKTSGETPAKVADKVYLLRNQFVHQFDVKNETRVSGDDFIKIIGFLLDVCSYFYVKYEDDLNHYS